MKISIQGYEGSFHQIAAEKYFGGEIEIVPCATFREVTLAVEKGSVNAG
ncbi:MAG: prephenate dehydratase domain-containing protein, partial [Rikenellaceae bacterium]